MSDEQTGQEVLLGLDKRVSTNLMTRSKQVFVTVIEIIQNPGPQLLLFIRRQGLKGNLSMRENSCVAFVGAFLPEFHFRLAWRDLQ